VKQRYLYYNKTLVGCGLVSGGSASSCSHCVREPDRAPTRECSCQGGLHHGNAHSYADSGQSRLLGQKRNWLSMVC
uniref:Uncharacterized protein n=1 Tax=Laticauda laticaudata TaxID=8630 RepID=A0A8C5SAC3_LATLA